MGGVFGRRAYWRGEPGPDDSRPLPQPSSKEALAVLTQKAARNFFVFGTVLFGGVFIALTIDTVRQVPQLTHAEALTPDVVAGKSLWEENNCMGCHTLLGEGAYYAPELTKVTERRDKAFLKAFLKDPEAMFPGERRMPNFHFNDKQIDQLIAFFDWMAKIDTQGFPPKPHLAQIAPPAQAAGALARPAQIGSTCLACHSLGGQGGAVGPSLDGIGSRRDEAWLKTWLADPAKVKPGTTMPNLQLGQADIDTLAHYLAQQK
jgi:nitric oxide reductase subunit C